MTNRFQVIQEYLRETVNLMKTTDEYFSEASTKSDLVFLKSRRAVLTELESKLNKMLDEFKDYYYKYFKSVSLDDEPERPVQYIVCDNDLYRNMYRCFLKLKEKNEEIRLVLDNRAPSRRHYYE